MAALLNFSAPYLATPNPPTTNYYRPPQPLPPLPPLQGPYSYPPPQKPFLAEEYNPQQHQFHAQAQAPQQAPDPGYTKVTDDGTKTNVHAVIDYDYDDGDEQPGSYPVTPIQGPIFIKNGSVPVVPLYSHPVLNNGTFVQIPVSYSLVYHLDLKVLAEASPPPTDISNRNE